MSNRYRREAKPLSRSASEEHSGSFMLMMREAGIGADFGIERCFERRDPSTKTSHHDGNDVIRADAQPLAGDLQREMAIAEMPGDPQQRGPVGCLDLEHRLGRRTDEQVATDVEFETVPVSELTGPRQIKQKG